MFLVKEESLEKIDGEIEEQTKTNDLEEEMSKAIEYKEHITRRKTKIRRALRKGREDSASVSSYEADSMRQNVNLPKLIIGNYAGDISQWQ